MTKFVYNDVIEECKLSMIAAAEREICRLATNVLEKRMAEYKEFFGGFSRTDANLWGNICIGYEVSCVGGDLLDEYNFDIDDAVEVIKERFCRGGTCPSRTEWYNNVQKR